MSTKGTRLDALLTPEESVLLLVDHQPFQFAKLHSHEPALVINNVVGLAKTAMAFGIPTILTTVLAERGGYLLQPLQDVFPDQKPINRTTLNAWEQTPLLNTPTPTPNHHRRWRIGPVPGHGSGAGAPQTGPAPE